MAINSRFKSLSPFLILESKKKATILMVAYILMV